MLWLPEEETGEGRVSFEEGSSEEETVTVWESSTEDTVEEGRAELPELLWEEQAESRAEEISINSAKDRESSFFKLCTSSGIELIRNYGSFTSILIQELRFVNRIGWLL